MLATHACVARSPRPLCKVVVFSVSAWPFQQSASQRCAGFHILQIILTLNCWNHVLAMPPLHTHCCHTHATTSKNDEWCGGDHGLRISAALNVTGHVSRTSVASAEISIVNSVFMNTDCAQPVGAFSCQYLERRTNSTCFIVTSFQTFLDQGRSFATQAAFVEHKRSTAVIFLEAQKVGLWIDNTLLIRRAATFVSPSAICLSQEIHLQIVPEALRSFLRHHNLCVCSFVCEI